MQLPFKLRTKADSANRLRLEQAKQAAIARQQSQVVSAAVEAKVEAESKAGISIYSDLRMLPDGRYVSLSRADVLPRSFPAEYEEHFAVILSPTPPSALEVNDGFQHPSSLAKIASQAPSAASPIEYHAALTETGTAAYCYLVVSPQYFNRREQMEIKSELLKRFRSAGNAAISPSVITLIATGDTIRAVHDKEIATSDDGTYQTSEVQAEVRQLLILAEKRGASDIHIETRDHTSDIYFRIHGIRRKHKSIAPAKLEQYMQVLWNHESTDAARGGSTWTKGMIQDTSFNITDEATKAVLFNVRFHTAPIHPAGNFKCVMRILRPSTNTGGARRLEAVGYLPHHLKQINEMVVGGSGIILVVGPTNSGKSTTLQSLAERFYEINGTHISLTTIENPVEYEIKRATQMQATSENFDTYLVASLRQDPDAVIVGEIRNEVAAKTTRDLGLAGHKIMTTLHVYEAAGAFERLANLGVDLQVLTMPGFISGVVYQRLCPVICPHCRISWSEARSRPNFFADPEIIGRVESVTDLNLHSVFLRNDLGCEHCGNTGIVGRTPLAEVLVPDETFLEYVKNREFISAKRHWKKHGTPAAPDLSCTALSHGILEMRKGNVDPRDVEKIIGLIRIES